MLNKIPVFLHIPKCGGTFVTQAYARFLNVYLQITSKKRDYRTWHVHIVDDNYEYAVLYVASLNNVFTPPIFTSNRYGGKHIDIRLENIHELNHIFKNKNMILFGTIIKPRGGRLIKNQFLEKLYECINAEPFYFTCVRRPYDRLASFYNYITSEASKHEPTHNIVKASDFESYLNSKQLQESWLIRTLAGVPDPESIVENHYREACSILKNFKIKDISELTELLIDVFSACYNFKVSKDFLNKIEYRNSTQLTSVKPSFDELGENTKKVFLNKTAYDYSIYDYCINKQD